MSVAQTGERAHGSRGAGGRARAAARRVPAAAWACALIALANGLAWSLIVPPFQVPDENAHLRLRAADSRTGHAAARRLARGAAVAARGSDDRRAARLRRCRAP